MTWLFKTWETLRGVLSILLHLAPCHVFRPVIRTRVPVFVYVSCSRASVFVSEWLNERKREWTDQSLIGGSKSKQLDVVSGVPQGSVLGPLLFLVYINDLPLHVEKSKLDLFADDVTLHSSSADMNVIENHLNCDIEKIDEWCLQNRMKINENKTKCMLMGTSKKISKLHNKELNIVVNGNQLNNVENEKLLGVHIDNNLAFHKHVDAVCGNITSKVALLNRIKQFLPLHAKKLYFNAYIYWNKKV